MADDYEKRKEWRMEFCAKTAPAIAKALAALEPDKEWHVEPLTQQQREDFGPAHINPAFISNDGERIWLWIEEYKRRIEARGSYGQLPNGRQWIPRDANLEDPQPSVSADKAPTQIAADIFRRLLPGYRVNLAAYRFRLKEAQDYKSRTLSLAAELTELSGGAIIFPTTPHRNGPISDEQVGDFYHPAINYGSIRVWDDGVRLEISMTGAGAKLFAAMLKVKVKDNRQE